MDKSSPHQYRSRWTSCSQLLIFCKWKCFRHSFFFSFTLFYFHIYCLCISRDKLRRVLFRQMAFSIPEPSARNFEQKSWGRTVPSCVFSPHVWVWQMCIHFQNKIQNAEAKERLPAFCLKTSLEPWFSPGLCSLHDDWSSKSFSEMPCQKWTTECVSSHVSCTPF